LTLELFSFYAVEIIYTGSTSCLNGQAHGYSVHTNSNTSDDNEKDKDQRKLLVSQLTITYRELCAKLIFLQCPLKNHPTLLLRGGRPRT